MGRLPITVFVLLVLFIETTLLCSLVDSCIQSERQALLSFKNGIKDPSNRLSSWVDKDCRKWKAVGCNNYTGHVVKLNPQRPSPTYADTEFGLPSVPSGELEAAEVDSCLLELKFLTYLDLSGNNFMRASIPKFVGSFERLRYLNLSYANFSGMIPHSIGNLSSLHVLDLNCYLTWYRVGYNNELTVDDVRWISRLSSLQHLFMSGINLNKAGDLAQVLNMLPSLLELHLSFCGLDNYHMPLNFVNFTSRTTLEYLDLSYNDYQGPIPLALQNLTSLKFLDLSSNLFNSTIPPWMGRLKNLLHLILNSNNFDGEIVDANLGNLTSLMLLDLSFNSIQGEIPSSLWNLCNLKVLDLSSNIFGREISKPLHNLSGCIGDSLESLYLKENKFFNHFPDWWGQLKNLHNLDLSRNSFHGPVPVSVGELSMLRSLDLSHNSFYDPIPVSVGRLSMLRSLDLSDNQFNGTIPESLGQLMNLEMFFVYSNSLEGTVSEVHFANLSRLEWLDISSNSLTFKVSFDWVPPFQVRVIYMRSCKIGPRFPQWLRTQKSMIQLDLSNASITDTIPKWFKDLPIKYLYLSQNQIHGALHNLPSNVTILDISNNAISGPLPQNIGVTSPLSSLLISGNLLNGSIPNSLCNAKILQLLDLSKNRLSGELPHCWGDDQTLLLINLSSNNLSGVIPSSIGNLTSLQSLHLNNNSLYGELPASFRNCRGLITLDLGENRFSGNIPPWIGENMSGLRILRLRSNLFAGDIPLQLCELIELQVMDLSQNDLSGIIPRCFGKLSSMVSGQMRSSIGSYYTGKVSTMASGLFENLLVIMKGRELEYTKTLQLVVSMDLSSNKLVGSIPEELMVLSGLIGLNVSNNMLTGTIPSNISELKSLESLDLSNNQLSGAIPQSMSSLNFLNHLNVSYNNLSGEIPSGHQLQTLNDPSIYVGNDELCGAPLPKQCPRNEQPRVPAAINDESNVSETIWFYIVVGLGYMTGLWGVLGVLLLNKTWRYAYFGFIDDVKDKINMVIVINVARMKKMATSD